MPKRSSAPARDEGCAAQNRREYPVRNETPVASPEAVSKTNRITPRTLKGFRDYLPEAMIPRERLIDVARGVYRSYGFSPIDTPALEYLEILAGKGGEETDKQLYQFEDHGGRRVGLRFDLTVPLARFAAQHIGRLGTPLKRYHIALVWRGENTQRGRYREFMQCDFDTIGTRSVAADVETVLVVHDLFRAIGFSEFTIRINNRMVLSGLLEQLDLDDQATPVLRALDKLAKVGPDRVAAEMTETAQCTEDQARQIVRLSEISGTNEEVLRQIEPLVAGSATGQAGLARLQEIVGAVRATGVAESRLQLDVSIARGLDYYTGTVLETFLDALPGIGSVCSGGRYDNLAELYTREELPGIGASLGLDRLLAAMEELGMIEKVATPAPVFIPYFDRDRLHDYLRLAAAVRAAGIGVEVFPEPKKLGQQLKYADRRGFRVALIAGESEFEQRTCRIKDLAAGQQQDVPLEDDAASILAAIETILGK
ncbi:MAG: histidine--tRNA ligase [Pirellulales bacterium]|nr:histidine--tRNA ligase [Pirellulales bacterium]